MKKFLLTIAIALCAVTAASAQMTEGDQSVSLKVGFGGSYGIPVTASYENALWGINDKSCVTIGGTVGYGSSKDSYSYADYKYSNLLFAARGMYHYALNSWDFSGGVLLGYNVASSSIDYKISDWADATADADSGGPLLGVNIGASYYFNDNWAASAEVGFGLAVINIGATYKF